MAAYLTLPGTSGNYVDTADVNLLDADTAHAEQGSELSANTSQIASTTLTRTAVSDAYFGSYVHRLAFTDGDVSDADSAEIVGSFNQEVTITDAVHTFSVRVRFSENWPDAARIVLWDNGNFAGASYAYSYADPTDTPDADGWWVASTEVTPDAGDLTGKLNIRVVDIDGQTLDGTEYVDLDAFCVRLGTSTDFVRSLRIVGDIDIETKAAVTDYTPSATEVLVSFGPSGGGDVGGFNILQLADGRMQFQWHDGSLLGLGRIAAADLPSNGVAGVFRFTYDESGSSVTAYVDGVAVTLDSSQNLSAWPPTYGGNFQDTLDVGQEARGIYQFDGDLYYVTVRDGIDGPIVAKFDADDFVGA